MVLICFFLFLAFGRSYCAAVTPKPPPYPVFPQSYYAKGEIRLPYAEIIEPFEAWYDGLVNRSRVDYYNGTAVTFQRPDIGKYGVNQKIAYMSNYTHLNIRTCFQANGTENATLKTPQSVFPNVSSCNYQYEGNAVYNNKQHDVWKCVDISKDGPDKVNTYRLWMTKGSSARPVRFQMMGYNVVFGSHYDKYEIIYTIVTPVKKVQPSTFDVPDKLNCTGFPGPGSRMLLNPINEFVNNDDSHVHQSFEDFKEKHNKEYSDKSEHEARKTNFKHNLRFIHSTNRQGLTYNVDVNHMADWNGDELKVIRGKLKYNGEYNGGLPFDPTEYEVPDVPDALDWRLYGAVNPVKDQAICGSCWSFGTTGTIEGAYFVETGKLVRLSEQALMDCSWGYGNNACEGGEDYRAYQWILNNTGIPLTDVYGPYLGQDGKCTDPKSISFEQKVQISGYHNITTNDIGELRLAMFHHGPISVSIDASPKSFSFYSNGVYYNPQCKNGADDLDHSVLAVGFGIINGERYWLIKNSWSTYWGNDGYVLINQKDNNCGVATSATFVKF